MFGDLSLIDSTFYFKIKDVIFIIGEYQQIESNNVFIIKKCDKEYFLEIEHNFVNIYEK
jgi:hypothetical protein